MSKPDLAAGRFDVTAPNNQRTIVITSQTDDEFELAEYLSLGTYRVTLRKANHVRGADDVFYTATSLGLHLDPTRAPGDITECSPGFDNGQAQVVVKIRDPAGNLVDSAFYLFAAIKD